MAAKESYYGQTYFTLNPSEVTLMYAVLTKEFGFDERDVRAITKENDTFTIVTQNEREQAKVEQSLTNLNIPF